MLEDGVRTLLGRLPSDRALWHGLADRFQIDLTCGVFLESWNRGFVLSSELMAELAERRIQLSVDIYFTGGDDESAT